MITDIHSEDRLVQATFANHLRDALGWESVYAHNEETFGPAGTLGRATERDVVLVRDLRAAVDRLNPDREDLDDQIWRTFAGCGLVDPKSTPRAASGAELKSILHRRGSQRFGDTALQLRLAAEQRRHNIRRRLIRHTVQT